MKYYTELSSYYFVQVVGDYEVIQVQVLWGEVKLDKKGRFEPGRRVITSSITKIIDADDEQYICTRNSIYKITKQMGEKIVLPANPLVHLMLNQGFSPLVIMQQIDIKNSDISTAIH